LIDLEQSLEQSALMPKNAVTAKTSKTWYGLKILKTRTEHGLSKLERAFEEDLKEQCENVETVKETRLKTQRLTYQEKWQWSNKTGNYQGCCYYITYNKTKDED